MKVLHLISSGGMYGAESVVAALARDLQQMGHSTRVGIFVNAHQPQIDVANQFEKRGVNVVRIPCRGRADRHAIGTIREIIHSDGADILHTHGYKADIYGCVTGSKFDLPMIATRHGHLWTRQTPAICAYEFLDALFLRHFDAVVAVSDVIAEEVRRAGISPLKVMTIDNGIDLSPFVSAPPTLSKEITKGDGLLVGTVARLVMQKGIDYFLRAARDVLKEFPNTVFAIVGDGPDRQQLERLAKGLAIGSNVVFTGPRSDMPSVYASLDIFVLASLDEGMPMAVLEALASGRPVIATEVGAVPKLVVSGETGILVRAADAAGLTQALLSLIRAPDLRRRLGRNGKALVQEQFSSGIMSRKYSQIYEDLLERKGRALDAAALRDQSA